MSLRPTGLVVHADWSAHANKRWLARAVPRSDSRWHAHAPEPVGPLQGLWQRLAGEAAHGAVLLGVDFPIGLPLAYAERAGITDFVVALREFGFDDGPWRSFYDVAARPDEIAVTRPFYPALPVRKGEARRSALIAGLGLSASDDLLRRCDHATTSRPRAAPLFWTLGAQQVGKAAIAGWRCLLGPALRDGVDLGIWPFDGPLERLLAERRFVVAETYPREAAAQLDLPFGRRSKRARATRLACAERLRIVADELGLTLDPVLDAAIADGFGVRGDAEDRFDAVVGLFGMLNVLTGRLPPGAPDEATISRVEGWILGQRAED